MEEKSFSFNGQKPGEKVVGVVKNHPFVLFWPGLKAVFLLVLAASSFLLWSNQYSGLAASIFVLVAAGIFFRSFYDYSQSVLVITSSRIINVDQNGFWKRRVTETEMDKIQDISSDTKGLFKVMLKFGDLIIRTAGAGQGSEIIVKNIPNPYSVQQKIVSINS